MQLQRRLVETNGIRLNIVQAGSGPVLVFLHGLGWDHQLWNDAIARYADRFHVIAGDTRGHGESDKPPGPYSIRQFADDWRGALDALGIDQARLVGFSQGGMIAMQLAVDQPDRFSGLFLAATRCQIPPPPPGPSVDRAAKLREEGPIASARDSARLIFSPAFMAAQPAYIENFVTQRAAAPAEPLLAAMQAGSGFDVCGQLGAYAGPCTVVAGGADLLTSAQAVAQLAEAMPGARFELVEGAGHMIPVEQPENFYALLDAFLARA
jgi:3-oxoadipate enol-lactonase